MYVGSRPLFRRNMWPGSMLPLQETTAGSSSPSELNIVLRRQWMPRDKNNPKRHSAVPANIFDYGRGQCSEGPSRDCKCHSGYLGHPNMSFISLLADGFVVAGAMLVLNGGILTGACFACFEFVTDNCANRRSRRSQRLRISQPPGSRLRSRRYS